MKNFAANYYYDDVEEYTILSDIANVIYNNYNNMKPDSEFIIKSKINELFTGINNLIEKLERKGIPQDITKEENLTCKMFYDSFLRLIKDLINNDKMQEIINVYLKENASKYKL